MRESTSGNRAKRKFGRNASKRSLCISPRGISLRVVPYTRDVTSQESISTESSFSLSLSLLYFNRAAVLINTHLPPFQSRFSDFTPFCRTHNKSHRGDIDCASTAFSRLSAHSECQADMSCISIYSWNCLLVRERIPGISGVLLASPLLLLRRASTYNACRLEFLTKN